jgi:hypothetical protein
LKVCKVQVQESGVPLCGDQDLHAAVICSATKIGTLPYYAAPEIWLSQACSRVLAYTYCFVSSSRLPSARRMCRGRSRCNM